MAQRNDVAAKKRLLIDGAELVGLVKVSEINYEQGVIDVPEQRRMRHITNGIINVPKMTVTYKVQKNGATLKVFRDWFFNREIHDVTLISTDAVGSEFARDLCSECECSKFTEPEFDAANPTFAQITVDLLPYEVTSLAAQA